LTERSQSSGTLSAAISNVVVQTFARQLGRGPTKARTHISNDTVVCMLRDSLTRAETSLVDSGRLDSVKASRLTFQEMMRGELVEGVEEVTGRKVVSFMSATDVEAGLSCELFVLDGSLGRGAPGPDSGNGSGGLMASGHGGEPDPAD
jgi:uncharacterized protein YbcI